MAQRDYYEVLGIARDASPEQIKKAYRTQARKHHPDVNPGNKESEKLFKEAQQAYDVLSDPEKRKLFDQFGHAAFEGVGAAGPRAGGTTWTAQQGPGFENFDFSDFFGPGAGHVEPDEAAAGGGGIFDELLGRVRGRRSGPRGGRSVEASLRIPFLTAVRGGETTIEVQRGDGRREALAVKIPPGTDTGSRLRLRGRGEPADRGGQAGDLIINVEVEPHPYFQREGRDLSVEVPVTIDEALLGARIDVPTLDGPKTLPIPAGTSSGQRLRLRGQGVPAHGKQPGGDLFIVLRIVVPKAIDDEGRRLIREFAERYPSKPRDGLWRE